MASNVPTIKQVSRLAVIVHILVIGLPACIFYLSGSENPFFYAALIYSVLYFGLKIVLTKNHRKGMNLVKRQNFADAIPQFEKSVEFFSKNSRIDKYRSLTLLSLSKMSYREMGLCNIGFCYSQIENGSKAKDFYQQVLKDSPENGIAKAALNMLNLTKETSLSEPETQQKT